jgi:hypothetical protein
MSLGLINRSPDLKRLRDEGYDVEIRSNYLLVKQVPYVNEQRAVVFGTLVSELTLSGERTVKPHTHVMHFAGMYPCHRDGSPINQIRNQTQTRQLAPEVTIHHSFSSKPPGGKYKDYYEKVTAYVRILSGPAESIDPNITATAFRPIEAAPEASVFRYLDTASSRAEIMMVASKLEGHRIAIVGLGGTGSYVLDLLAKTPVAQIDLFDGDDFLQHNAFRAPGAAGLADLEKRLKKVEYFRTIYDRMHANINAHAFDVTEENVHVLKGMDFVFMCRDGGPGKAATLERLEAFGIPYIDVGMGVELVDDSLLGTVRVTTSTCRQRDHVAQRIPLADTADEDEYCTNIQIADLNALNAALAVIKWKKLMGFYVDLEREHHSTYTISGNDLINEDLA